MQHTRRITVDEFASRTVGIDYVDITHSINGRRQKTGDSRTATRASELGRESISGTAISKVSIADFLEIVNTTHRSILSDSVLQHFDEIRPEEGHYTGKVLFKLPVGEDISFRTLLANAFEGMAQNDIEKQKIADYREKLETMEAEEQKLQELNRQIKEFSFAKGPRDTQKIRKLQLEARQTANRIGVYDKQLLRLEATKPLQNVLQREKKKAYQRAEQRGKEALAAYKEETAGKMQDLRTKYQESRKRLKTLEGKLRKVQEAMPTYENAPAL